MEAVKELISITTNSNKDAINMEAAKPIYEAIRMNAVQIFEHKSNAWKTVRLFALDKYEDAKELAKDLIQESVQQDPDEEASCGIVAEVNLLPALLDRKLVYVIEDTKEVVMLDI